MRRGTPRASGFTLMEVMIALSVMAFAIFGAISVISFTTRMNMANRERMLAMRAAEKKVEQMLSCSDFDDIYNKFKDQTEGFGWEQVDGLEPVDPAPLPPPTDAVAYTYPSWTNKALPPPRRPNLFVRFPLNDAGIGFDEAQGSNAKFKGTGVFADSYQVDAKGKFILDSSGKRIPVDLDLNGNGTTNKNPDDVNVPVSKCKILPVSIEVYWRGTNGPNTYLIYKYTFLRKT